MKVSVVWKVHCRGVHISANIKIEIQQNEETSQAALANFHVHHLVSLSWLLWLEAQTRSILLKFVRLKVHLYYSESENECDVAPDGFTENAIECLR